MRGDNYWNLAETFYGDGMMWPKLHEANSYAPKALPIGATLTIPPAS